MTWADFQSPGAVTLTTAINHSQFDLLAPYRTAGGLMQGLTITRTLITIITAADGPSGGLDAIRWGLIVTGSRTDPAADPLGFAPVDDPYEDWMWNKTVSTVAPPGSTINLTTGTSPVCATSWDFDIRSKRKLDELGQSLWLNYQLIGSTITDTSIQVTARVLLQLP